MSKKQRNEVSQVQSEAIVTIQKLEMSLIISNALRRLWPISTFLTFLTLLHRPCSTIAEGNKQCCARDIVRTLFRLLPSPKCKVDLLVVDLLLDIDIIYLYSFSVHLAGSARISTCSILTTANAGFLVFGVDAMMRVH
jgi:hypothetical protein